MTTLVLSSRHTPDAQALWRAAVRRRWAIERIRGISVPAVDDADLVIYVEALLAETIAKKLGRALLDPSADWLSQLPSDLRGRTISLTTLGEARKRSEPTFVKPPNDKTFAAAVYATGAALPREYDDDTAVLIAEPVVWRSEYRCFCLDGTVLAASPYRLDGEHAARLDYVAPRRELRMARDFAERALSLMAAHTPRAIVVDVGTIEGHGWAVVEANGAWGAGIYGCDPDRVLDVIRHATVNL